MRRYVIAAVLVGALLAAVLLSERAHADPMVGPAGGSEQPLPTTPGGGIGTAGGLPDLTVDSPLPLTVPIGPAGEGS